MTQDPESSQGQNKTDSARPLTIYKASAGSGKTYTLAYQYIKLLLGIKQHDGTYRLNRTGNSTGHRAFRRRHSHILAITFTNKATAEMKSRILSRLDELSKVPSPGEKDCVYANGLMKELSCNREELAEAAGTALFDILFDYNVFNVSTIDAFFQSVLRCFAREVDRQGDFRLELDNRMAIRTAVGALLDEVNNSDDTDADKVAARSWLQAIALDEYSEGKEYNPFNRNGEMHRAIIKVITKSFEGKYKAEEDTVLDYLADPSRLHGFIRHMKELSSQMIAQERASTQKVLDALAAANLSLESLNRFLIPYIKSSLTAKGWNREQVDKLFDSKKPKFFDALDRGGTVDGDGKQQVYVAAVAKKGTPAEVDAAIIQWYATVSESAPLRLYVYTTLRKAAAALQGLAYINKYISDFRTENNLILIEDTTSLLEKIIDEDETPFIYERMGVELHHFLIDEFQDTSLMQWKNLKPLLSNAFGWQHDSLIIGDVKQSIYAWRGADSSLLDSEVETVDFPRYSLVKGSKAGENTNFRSAHGIVRFNNTLFQILAAKSGISSYNGVAQALNQNIAGLTSQVSVIDLKSKNAEDALRVLVGKYAGKDAGKADEFLPLNSAKSRQAAFYLTAEEILRQHDERGYAWSDIAILFRKKKEAAEMIEFLLAEYPQIKLVSEEALLLINSRAVKLVISMLEMLDKSLESEEPSIASLQDNPDAPHAPVNNRHTPADSASRQRALIINRFHYYLSQGLDTESALMKALDFKDSVDGDTDCPESIEDDVNAIRKSGAATLPVIVETIISNKLTEDERKAELPYITAFVDVVMEFTENYNATVHKFMEYWRDCGSNLAIPGGDGVDAIKIMTVHKAKGLEWDCVHLPLMSWNFEDSADADWFSLKGLKGFTEEPYSSLLPPLLYFEPNKVFKEKWSPCAKEINDTESKLKADNLNVAYVAFTRAVRELSVIMPVTQSSTGQLRPAIIDAFADTEIAPQGEIFMPLSRYIDDYGNFLYGEPTFKVIKDDDDNDSENQDKEMPEMPVYDSFHVRKSPVDPRLTHIEDITSRLDNREENDPDIGTNVPQLSVVDTPSRPGILEEATRRGVDLHAILAEMYYADDLEDALRTVLRGNDYDRADEYRSIIEDAIGALGDRADLWFGDRADRVLCEQTIFFNKRDEFYRLDRVVYTADGTVDIIDYKFTSHESPEHIRQVQGYIGLMRGMGLKNVRGFIWYPLKKKVTDVCC